MKERLVGAAVLMAAAVILIPEMLSGPEHREETAARSHDESFKTFTIDLNRSPGAPATTPIEERAPPPEAEPSKPATEEAPDQESDAEQRAQSSAPDSESTSENPPESAQVSPESASPTPRTSAQSVVEREPPPAQRLQQQDSAGSHTTTPPAAIASTSTAPTSQGWAIQLGSFASRATAERMAKEFSGAGRSAFVMPVKSGANTLYRVRVGPFSDRAAANAALAGIRKRVANAAVVAHP